MAFSMLPELLVTHLGIELFIHATFLIFQTAIAWTGIVAFYLSFDNIFRFI
jgi:hypothetical protein